MECELGYQGVSHGSTSACRITELPRLRIDQNELLESIQLSLSLSEKQLIEQVHDENHRRDDRPVEMYEFEHLKTLF